MAEPVRLTFDQQIAEDMSKASRTALAEHPELRQVIFILDFGNGLNAAPVFNTGWISAAAPPDVSGPADLAELAAGISQVVKTLAWAAARAQEFEQGFVQRIKERVADLQALAQEESRVKKERQAEQGPSGRTSGEAAGTIGS